MKLLSDFDGVWTYPDAEGAAHGAALDAALLALAAEGQREAMRTWIAEARRVIRLAPERWGWSAAGRLSAFADEDPFTEQGALLHYIESHRHEPLPALLVAEIEKQGRTLDSVSGQAHVTGVREVEERRGPGITPDAGAAGRALLAAGVEIAVVSNSPTTKLLRWFEHAGVPTCVHPERRPGALRLRGSARKFVLSEGTGEAIEVGGLRVDISRPHYAAVLAEEAPGAVVGDVFSIDIALPLALKRREPGWSNVRLFWLVHPYTPARMRRAVAELGREVEPIENGLPGVVEKLLAHR
jgi:hypothetical protein